MSAPFLRVLDSPQELAREAAREVVELLGAALRERGRARLVLAGGSTPRALYRELAAEPLRSRLDWTRVECFFGDERCVPPEDERSNYRMARESLLDPLELDARAVHRMRGELGPEAGAREYERELERSFGAQPARFDLILLGLGADGHTASLFPGDAALAERELRVAPACAPVEPRDRITLTLPVLCEARALLFLVAGGDKAAALARVLSQEGQDALPAALARPARGELLWRVDRAAAALLDAP